MNKYIKKKPATHSHPRQPPFSRSALNIWEPHQDVSVIWNQTVASGHHVQSRWNVSAQSFYSPRTRRKRYTNDPCCWVERPQEAAAPPSAGAAEHAVGNVVTCAPAKSLLKTPAATLKSAPALKLNRSRPNTFKVHNKTMLFLIHLPFTSRLAPLHTAAIKQV